MKKCFLFFAMHFSFYTNAQHPGDNFFNSSQVHNIYITFKAPADWWDSLQYYHTNGDSIYMKADVVIDSDILVSKTGIKLKGNSSYGYPGQKKPIKLKFDEYDALQTYDNLKRLNLSNNMLDPTHMREKLYLDFLNRAGFDAPRCTYARVYYNNQYVGLYKAVEQVDKTFLKTHYGNKGGNLFKGDPGGTLVWLGTNQNNYYSSYELHTNETRNDWSDLIHLIDEINNTPPAGFRDSLEMVLNTEAFINNWAAENLFVDMDKYYHNGHNYYLYHNTASNKFEYVPWDCSVVFGFFPMMFEPQKSELNIFHIADSVKSGDRPLVRRMLQDKLYKTGYLNAICRYMDYFDDSLLFPRIDSIAAVIYPDIVAEPDANQMFPDQMFYPSIHSFTLNPGPIGDIPALKKFIIDRRISVKNQLKSLGWICPVSSTGSPSVFEYDFTTYPNPFSNTLTIFYEVPFGEPVSLIVYNSLGQRVTVLLSNSNFQSIGRNTLTLNLDNLEAGMYMLNFVSGNFSKTAKLMKTK